MRENDVLADIRAVRDELARRYGGDAGTLSRALVERSHEAGRVVVRFPPRPPQPLRAIGLTLAVTSAPLDAEPIVPNEALLQTGHANVGSS